MNDTDLFELGVHHRLGSDSINLPCAAFARAFIGIASPWTRGLL
jgi:hypothetical protein